jgi:hypothetical protein
MRIFEITDFIDRASDIMKTGQPNRVATLVDEIKKAGPKVINQVKILLSAPKQAATAATQTTTTQTTAPAQPQPSQPAQPQPAAKP